MSKVMSEGCALHVQADRLWLSSALCITGTTPEWIHVVDCDMAVCVHYASFQSCVHNGCASKLACYIGCSAGLPKHPQGVARTDLHSRTH